MERNNEPISALIDGELERSGSEFLIRRMSGDEQMLAVWQRIHIVRACMRGEFSGSVSLVGQVREALHGEPDLEQPQLPPTAARQPGWMRYGLGGALAAGVAVVAVIGLGQRVVPDSEMTPAAVESTGFVSQQTALDRQISRQAVPAGFNSSSAESGSNRITNLNASQRQRINRYVIRHGQAAGNSGFVTFTPILTEPVRATLARDEQATASDKRVD
ncbi:MAG: sigma-E factor negative regulatory protein [Xanthomonadaceae bacterium]|nr:sigma-E factor negative regulatory protein [Xanthomonadaceae bacterium]